ncbi:hypothetical protein BGZ99_002382 [Dissophora globulifera]|uniref:CBM21 domain-containing protein n=1 Tax=Dissophora globulifera TaxID=979702 RepID=A0A9P6RMT8_9FUNG|nr:hypothetical protein BGZ99_002382 [Dissophora globulifera]
MSFSASPAEPSPQPFVLSSPDRVVVRALPHPLASTNKKVTLSLRRTSTFPTADALLSPTTSTFHEPSTVPQNSPIANTHRRTMISTLTSSIQDQDLMLTPRTTASSTTSAEAASPLTTPNMKLVRPSLLVLNTTTSTHTPSPLSDNNNNNNNTLSKVRKYSAQFHKNGMPIKSALKSPPLPSNATIEVAATAGSRLFYRQSSIRSHSSPTPLTSPKYVHFNTQLEHVRLFLQGETPACVSERETLLDALQHDHRSTSDIKLTLPNWMATTVEEFKATMNSSSTALAGAAPAPMRIERMTLSEDQAELEGKILVENIAFHKHVSVRYTTDFWQSYTEVSAEFEESVVPSTVDRFSFVISLEMDRTMVEKTFCMAVRYQVNGREFWDSNQGKNYHVECKRVVVVVAPERQIGSDLSKQMNTLLLGGSPLSDSYSKPVIKKKLAGRYDLSTSLSAAYSQPITIPTSNSTRSFPSGPNFKVEAPPALKVTSSPGSQSAYRASEYITPSSPSPQNYHHSLYASSPKFLTSYLSSAMAAAAASPPDHFHLGFDLSSKRGGAMRSNSWHVETDGSSPSSLSSSPNTSFTASAHRPQSFSAGFYGSSPKGGSAPISIPMAGSGGAPKMLQTSRPAVGSSSYFDLVDRYCFYQSSPNISPYNSYPNSPPAPCIRG